MIIKCSKDVLLEHIHVVSKAVSNRTTLPILECVLLVAENLSFKMMANDLEMAIESSNIQADIIETGSVALEAKIFFEIIRRLPDGMVTISVDKNNVTIIKCEKSEFKILGLSGEEFPSLPNVEKHYRYKVKAAELKNLIRKTIFSVSLDETKPVLTGELFEIKNGELHMVAVDGFRVAYSSTTLAEDIPETQIVIPSKTLNEISKILPNQEDAFISLYMTDKHVLMEMEGYTIVSRLLEGDFIKYEQLFTEDYSTIVTADRHLLILSLERASLIASKEIKKNPIKLKIEDDLLTISSNTEVGTVTDEMSVEVDGNNLEIAFNPRYLMDALKAIEDNIVTLQFTTSLSPCIMKSAENDYSKYLVLPLRLNS